MRKRRRRMKRRKGRRRKRKRRMKKKKRKKRRNRGMTGRNAMENLKYECWIMIIHVVKNTAYKHVRTCTCK